MSTPTAASASAVTKCPHCGAKFRVRQEHVRLHSGLVRCGACRGIFDAMENLIEGSLPPQKRSANIDPEAGSPRTIVQDGQAIKRQVEAAARQHEQTGAAPPAERPVSSPAVSAPDIIKATTPAPVVPDTVVPAPAMQEEAGKLRSGTSLPSSIVGEGTAEPRVRNVDSASADQRLTDTAKVPHAATETRGAAPEDNRPDKAETSGDEQAEGLDRPQNYRWRAPSQPVSRTAKWVYAVLSLLALLALLGQAAYLYRDELSSRYPQTMPVLEAGCRLLRCEVGPPKRSSELGFVYSGLEADPAHRGLLVFVATLRNSSDRAVAYPHLILTLDGLDGQIASRRIFAPNEYLPASANLANGLDGRAEIEIKIYLDASQTHVVGFKVDHAYL